MVVVVEMAMMGDGKGVRYTELKYFLSLRV